MNDTAQAAQSVPELELRYPINVFKSVAARRPIKSAELTAAQFAQFLRVRATERKEDAPLLTVVRYRRDAESRGIADIADVHAVYGDIDHDFKPEAFEAGMQELREAGVQVVAHQTYRHSDQAPRWRVYVLLDEPIQPADYLACWEGLNAIFGGMLDGNAKDCARLNYWPSCPAGETRELRTLNVEATA